MDESSSQRQDLESQPLLGEATRRGNAARDPSNTTSPEQEPAVSPATDSAKEKEYPATPTWRILIGASYMCAMGVCGIVLTAIGSTLTQLAENCDSTALAVSTVFLARGAGAITGSLSSSKLYSWFHGNHVMICTLVWLAVILICLPFCTKVWFLHVLFACLGFGTAVTDTGCQIMTRKAHGKSAGPWLGANTVTFGIAGVLVPLLEIFTDSLVIQYSILSAVSLLIAIAILLVPVPAYLGMSLDKKRQNSNGPAPSHHGFGVEFLLSLCAFCLIGGKVTVSSYIELYIEDTGALPYSDSSVALAILWIFITLGRLLGLKDQINLQNKEQLYTHVTVWLVTGCTGMLVMMISEKYWATWIGISLYGFGNGPCVGYVYDLNNRITIPSELGMAIVMFGLNLGASVVPYLTATVWNHSGYAYWMLVSTLLTQLIPIFALHSTKLVESEEVGFKLATPTPADTDSSR